MISITPQGSVYLCKTPLENDYNHQLTFTSQTEQLTYFTSKVQRTENDYTYLKKDNQIVVGIPIDDIIDCNYLFYRNNGFTTKYYFCFITNMEYINENATRITIEMDVWQTYQFALVNKECFVEREHVNDDTIGANLVPEGLETGEYVINNVEQLDELASTDHVVVAVTKAFDDVEGERTYIDTSVTPNVYYLNPTVYNGVFSGLVYYVFKEYKDACNFIAKMEREELTDNVISVFMIPGSLYNTNNWKSWQDTYGHGGIMSSELYPCLDFKYNVLPSTYVENIMLNGKTIAINTDLNGYTPVNNKLFTKEFNYINLTNNIGNTMEMAYEDFINNTPKFRIIGNIGIGCSIRLIPENYKLWDTSLGSYVNDLISYGIVCGKYPTCSWNSDSFTNWMTEQGVNNIGEGIQSIGMGGMLASVNPILAGTNILSGVTDIMKTLTHKDKTPVKVNGATNCADVTYSCGMNRFTAIQMSVRYEFAERIDKYFSAFGYKVNDFKLPNLTGRTNWNYVKTVGCNFEGDIPQVYLNKIKEIFNNGITLWHTTTHFLDYSQTNSIVTP